MNKVKIYAIINPLTDAVIYIGASRNPYNRYSKHNDGDSWRPTTYKGRIVSELQAANLDLELLILDDVDAQEAKFWEEFYTELFMSWGFYLQQTRGSNYSVRERIKNNPNRIVNIPADTYDELKNLCKKHHFFLGRWVDEAIKEKMSKYN